MAEFKHFSADNGGNRQAIPGQMDSKYAFKESLRNYQPNGDYLRQRYYCSGSKMADASGISLLKKQKRFAATRAGGLDGGQITMN